MEGLNGIIQLKGLANATPGTDQQCVVGFIIITAIICCYYDSFIATTNFIIKLLEGVQLTVTESQAPRTLCMVLSKGVGAACRAQASAPRTESIDDVTGHGKQPPGMYRLFVLTPKLGSPNCGPQTGDPIT